MIKARRVVYGIDGWMDGVRKERTRTDTCSPPSPKSPVQSTRMIWKYRERGGMEDTLIERVIYSCIIIQIDKSFRRMSCLALLLLNVIRPAKPYRERCCIIRVSVKTIYQTREECHPHKPLLSPLLTLHFIPNPVTFVVHGSCIRHSSNILHDPRIHSLLKPVILVASKHLAPVATRPFAILICLRQLSRHIW